jgi:hypothetical protein
MRRVTAALLVLLSSLVCEASPIRGDDGISLKPRASRPSNIGTGKKAIWLKTDGTLQVSTSTLDERISASPRITVAVTNPYATSTLASATVYSAIYWIPPDVTTVQVQIGQRQLFTPDGASAATNSMKISCGQPSVDRQSFVGSPTNHTGLTWPAYTLSSAVSCTVARDASGYMMFRWTIPAGASFIEYTTNAGQGGYVKSQTGTAPTVGCGWVDTDQPAGQLLITYSTAAPRLVIWNDSIQRGLAAAGECGLLNTLVRLGPNRGYAVSVVGVGFARAARFSLLDNWMLGGDLSNVAGAHVLISLGTNDLFGTACAQATFCSGSDTSVNIIGHLRRAISQARAMGARSIGLATIISSAGYSGPQDAERLLVNSWIRQQIGTVDYVLDMDATIGATGVNPTWFATGNVHLKTLGFDAIEPTVPVLN